ncbi:hypothetical protein PU629_02075 [Pullulanibacillus sp. KACC 23026]|uniref:hypothetical protein n=1 Tax=Pullulanibacillus sp. KACC 23026 TaxID=3028315 RepID=UPI0023B062B0|nr:hypothetical protein [Pullulanibacillus sp. KACC 23026]WEG13172.1 hypothetical protein PU629_02075 [Pullulanibacillus sp. KACC 23026]
MELLGFCADLLGFLLDLLGFLSNLLRFFFYLLGLGTLAWGRRWNFSDFALTF